MKNTEIKKIMLKMGGHCEESLTDIQNAETVEKLAAVLFNFIKPCMEKDFPTYELIKHFRVSGEPFGVFVDSRGEFTAKGQNILYGNSDITLTVQAFDVVRIYLKHTSKLKIKARENAMVIIYRFDNSGYEVTENINAKITCYGSID